MHKKVIEFNLNQRKKDLPELRSGDVVKVYRKIKEAGKERIQIFEGMVIAIKGRQSSSPMITVRKVSFGVGVELIFPLYSPSIEKVEKVKRAKVRRAKLYYVRDKSIKSLKLKYTEVESDKATKKKEEVKKESASAESEKKEEEKVSTSLK